jgi:hypothetical protein
MRLRFTLLVVMALILVPAGDAAASSRASLKPGQALRPGQALAAGAARLVMHPNGDLALYYVPLRAGSPLARRARPPRPDCRTRRCRFLRPRRLWHTRSGHPGARLLMRADGAAVVLSRGKVLWSSRTQRRGASLRLRRDGDLGIYAPVRARAGGARAASFQEEVESVWSTGTETPEYVGDELGPGEALEPGRYLQTANGQYELDMSPQGWMVLWVRGAGPCPMFVGPSTGGNSPYLPRQAGSTLNMEADGSLLIRGPEATELWWMRNYDNPHDSAQPTPVPNSRLVLEADGNLAVLAPGGTVVWQTETNHIRGSVLCPGESLWYGQLLGSVYSGPGSSYQASYYMQVATANRGRGSEVNVSGAGDFTTSHLYRDKTGPSAEGMYLQMQNWGDLQLLLDGGDGVPIWETGTTFHNAFATVSHLGSLQLFAPMFNAEGKRVFNAIYENPNAEEELADGLGKAEKISMSMAPAG